MEEPQDCVKTRITGAEIGFGKRFRRLAPVRDDGSGHAFEPAKDQRSFGIAETRQGELERPPEKRLAIGPRFQSGDSLRDILPLSPRKVEITEAFSQPRPDLFRCHPIFLLPLGAD